MLQPQEVEQIDSEQQPVCACVYMYVCIALYAMLMQHVAYLFFNINFPAVQLCESWQVKQHNGTVVSQCLEKVENNTFTPSRSLTANQVN